jgi:hypothetical protein
MTKANKRIYDLIDTILWEDWDPIGVKEMEGVRDEYVGYITSVFNLKINGADKVKITQHLFNLETINMGLSGNIKHCEIVAEKIVSIK